MEQETKFEIINIETQDLIWKEIKDGIYGAAKDIETVIMKAAYFDTKDNTLKNHGIALRLRHENDKIIETIKWGSEKGEDGLFIHEESNVNLDKNYILPPLRFFKDKINGKTLNQIVGFKKITKICETNFERRRAKVSYNKSLVEIALDNGKLLKNDKEGLIREIEIELYDGNLDDVLSLTKLISEKYNLKPQNKSKYKRALEL